MIRFAPNCIGKCRTTSKSTRATPSSTTFLSNLEYKSNEKYPIYNGGDVVGYYTIDGDKMVATYTRGESAGSNIEAFVTTDGTITSNKTGGSAGGDTSFTFPDMAPSP